ncbi:hypothetical protein ACLIMP_22725 [Novosphingobium aerophilum]|uniref:hypothetical protein n=1 Tax=Novosphingobium aerophilum TaxID=2839843 RepID=UPI003FD01A0F
MNSQHSEIDQSPVMVVDRACEAAPYRDRRDSLKRAGASAMTNTQGDVEQLEAVSPWVLALRAELANGSLISRGSFGFGKLTCNVAQGKDTLWAILRCPEHGGLAIRLAYAPGGIDRVKQLRRRPGENCAFRSTAPWDGT